jgi:hypothetical protein
VTNPFANGSDAAGMQVQNPFASNVGGNNPFANGPDAGGAFWSSLAPFVGGGADSPHTLGDLTPTQLRQLSSAGLLNNVPLTPQQADFLQRNGLGVPDGANPTLGQLTPRQLDALRQAGLLDSTPIPEAAMRSLLPPAPTAPVDTSAFPTTVNGLDVSPGTQHSGAGMTLGDVSRPGAAAHPDFPGLLAGTGGLSSVPGVSGTPGALSPAGLGLTAGGNGAGGAGAVGGTGANGGPAIGPGDQIPGSASATDGLPFGGMPYMPGMFGGAGQPKEDRERQRNTWLKEDEEVWGTDPACAPAVIGRGGGTARVEDDEYPAPADERTARQYERRPYRGR